MEIENLIKKAEELEGNYLWRFMDIHKFIDLLFFQCIHFTRMDLFEDSQEGISQRLLLEKASNNNTSNNIKEQEDFIFQQKSNYINSWFLSKRESVAMWGLYSEPGGVAIRIPSNGFINFFEDKSNFKPEFLSPTKLIIGEIIYKDFLDKKTLKSRGFLTKYAGLRKDKCWEHEKEIRILLRKKHYNNGITELDQPYIRLKIMELTKLKFEVIFHPRTVDWHKKNINKLITNSGFKINSSDSELMLN